MSKIYSNLYLGGQLIYNNNPQSGYILTTDENGLVSWTSSISVIATASSNEFGLIKIGSGLSMSSDGFLSLENIVIPDEQVFFDQNDPSTPGVVFDPDIQLTENILYVSDTNSSTWTYNGVSYSTFGYTASNKTPFLIYGTTTDAGGNKTSMVYRNGSLASSSFNTKRGLTSTSVSNNNKWWKVFEYALSTNYNSDSFKLQMNESNTSNGTGKSVIFNIVVKRQDPSNHVTVNIESGLSSFDLNNFDILYNSTTKKLSFFYRITTTYTYTNWLVLNSTLTSDLNYRIIWSNTLIGISLSGETNDTITTKTISLNKINGAYSLPTTAPTSGQVLGYSSTGSSDWITSISILATASDSTLGGIIVGTGLTVSNSGVLSLSESGTSSITSLQSGVFKANISQITPKYLINDELPLGTIWTIATYSIGDDFSNMELIRASTFSGTINGTGSILRAIDVPNSGYNTLPTVWSNGSVLRHDGSPYYTSLNSDGNFGPFYNSFNQDFNFSYIGLGVYQIASTGSFVYRKHSFSIINHSGGFDMVRSIRIDNNKYWIITNDIASQNVSVDGTTFSTSDPSKPIGYTASFGFSNKDQVLYDAYITIERWV